MSLTLALPLLRQDATDTGPARLRTADWPLIGDIVSARGGVPDHLIRWRRDEGEPDPDPQL